jgi:hypothetical protein
MAEGDSWNQVREALGGIVDIAIQYGSKGLDLHFMHQSQFAENMRVWKFFRSRRFFSANDLD